MSRLDQWFTVAVLVTLVALVILRVHARAARPQHDHMGRDACVVVNAAGDTISLVPEVWLVETRAQRDSARAAAAAWQDSTTKYRGWRY